MVSLPERNTSISYHLTNQPGAGLTVSRGLRETPDTWRVHTYIHTYIHLLLFAGTYPGYCSLRRWLLAFVDGTWGRTYFVSFLGFPLFSSCGGFSVVHAFFGVFGISADSRYCPRVASSSQLRKLDGNLLIWVVRGSPPVVSWHTLDRNLPIWVVRGSPPVVRWPTLDGNPAILRQGPALRAKARQELHGSAVPLGLPFDLNYEVYASSCSTSSGALGQSPRGTQGIFQDALNKMFSFREEERSATRWS